MFRNAFQFRLPGLALFVVFVALYFALMKTPSIGAPFILIGLPAGLTVVLMVMLSWKEIGAASPDSDARKK